MMTAHATMPALQPFSIGQGFSDRNGNAWIAAIEPNAAPSALLIGGPTPMAAIRWNVTIVRESLTISVMDEHTVARHMERQPIAAILNAPGMLQEALAKRDQMRADARAQDAIADEKRAASKAALERYRPAWAESVIIAELHHDDSDSMTDYHNHKTTRRVVLGWSKHNRDLFPELRKAAATFPETADLADADEKAEHREKYSMGAGFYLKRGWRDSSGWCVKKTRAQYLHYPDIEFSDAAKGVALAPAVAKANASEAARFTISHHIHTKKGFDMWICSMAHDDDDAERAAIERLCEAWGVECQPDTELSDLGDSASVREYTADDYAHDAATAMLDALKRARALVDRDSEVGLILSSAIAEGEGRSPVKPIDPPSLSFDVSVPMMLEAVVRGVANASEAMAIGQALADRFAAASEEIDGAAYGQPRVTAFSIHDNAMGVAAMLIEGDGA